MSDARANGRLGGVAILLAAAAIVIMILLAARPLMALLLAHVPTLAGSAPLSETVFNVLVFGLILSAALVGGRLNRRDALALGPQVGRHLAIGLAIGFAGITVSMLYARLAGTLGPGEGGARSIGLLVWGALIVLLQTVAEEAYFRGLLQPVLRARWGVLPALAATAIAFAALHVAGGARAPLSLVNLCLGGLVFGLLAERFHGLAAPIGAHFAWNAIEQLGYGLDPNPGAGSFGAIIDWDLVGPAAWGGSAEGLNASIAMTFALLAILTPLVVLSWRGLASPPRAVKTI